MECLGLTQIKKIISIGGSSIEYLDAHGSTHMSIDIDGLPCSSPHAMTTSTLVLNPPDFVLLRGDGC